MSRCQNKTEGNTVYVNAGSGRACGRPVDSGIGGVHFHTIISLTNITTCHKSYNTKYNLIINSLAQIRALVQFPFQ